MVEYGVDGDAPSNLGATMGEAYRQRELRIVALRAAAQVVAAQHKGTPPEPAYPKATLDVADMFAQWLETGER